MSLIDEPVDDIGAALPEPQGDELVHWMKAKPLRVGPAGLSATAGVAFSLGVVATLGVLTLIGWLGPERLVMVPPRRWRA